MAPYTCCHLNVPSIFPAKFPTVNSLILRTPSHSTRRTQSRSFSIPSLNANSTQKYVYPDPIPAFADAETPKFKIALRKALSKDEDVFGNDLGEVVDVCAKIVHEYLSKEYGGPGTLLVEPFTNMLIALKEHNLPGAALAARASLLWAQNHIDHDWLTWNSISRDQVNHLPYSVSDSR